MGVIVAGSRITMRPSQIGSEEYEIRMDEERIDLVKGEKKVLKTKNQEVIKILRPRVDVLVIETPYSKVVYDGENVEVENTKLTVTNLQGLCGNGNWDKRDEIVTAQSCIAKTQESAAMTYRLQSKSCSRLPSKKQQIQDHQQQKQQQQIAKIGQKETEECTARKHSIVKQGKSVCISQIPIVECGSGCAPRTNIEKSVPFTCLPENRPQVAKMYEDKVKRGEILPELRSMDSSFS